MPGAFFEAQTRDFLDKAFGLISHLRPGEWKFSLHGDIVAFDQYEHLANLSQVLNNHKDLRAALGDYLVKPDILVGRMPVADEEINRNSTVLTDDM